MNSNFYFSFYFEQIRQWQYAPKMVVISSPVIDSARALLISTIIRRLLTYRPSASVISLMHLSYKVVTKYFSHKVVIK